MARTYIFLVVLMVMALSPPVGEAQQNTAVGWYTLSGGFGVSKDTATAVVSVAGQQFVGLVSGFGNNVQSGFLADTLMRSVLVLVKEPDVLPTTFDLHQNYPNPFNPTTTIRFDIARTARVVLSLYSILGQEISRMVDGELSPGSYTVMLDARSLASGVYLYRLNAGDFSSVKKLVLAK